MGGNKDCLGAAFQTDFQHLSAIQPQDRTAIGADIAKPVKYGIDPFRAGDIRDQEQVMDFPDPAVFL